MATMLIIVAMQIRQAGEKSYIFRIPKLAKITAIQIFGSANTTTLPVVMLSYLQNQFDPSIAAISTVQMLIAIVLLVAVEKIYGLRAING